MAVVVDLYLSVVVGWSMQANMRTEVILDAMLIAKWRRQPQRPVMIYSDQGSQFGSNEFCRWCKENNPITSMSRRSNCYDSAVAESFFCNLKKEKIKNRIYITREEAKSDVLIALKYFTIVNVVMTILTR